MNAEDVKRLLGNWPGLENCLKRARLWDGSTRILLITNDFTAEDSLKQIAELVEPTAIIDLGTQVETQEHWNDKVSRALGISGQLRLDDPPYDRTSLLAPKLHQAPQWLVHSLKLLFEHNRHPFCCIASTNRPEALNESLASFFLKYRKVG